MERVFSFDEDGKNTRSLVCPQCGAVISTKELTYTEEGDVVVVTDKKGNPSLVYQTSNPAAINYGKLVKVKPKVEPKNDKPKYKNKKPIYKNKKGGEKPNVN